VRNIFSPIKKLLNIESVNKLDVSNITYCVLDTETTGLNYSSNDKIISISAVKIRNLEIQDEKLDEFVNPGFSIPSSSFKIHHISDQMVKNSPNIYNIEPKLREYFKRSVLVGHNIEFDCSFIARNLSHTQLESRVREAVKIDTIYLAAGLFPNFESYELTDLCNQLKISYSDQKRHSSLGDAIVTARLFMYLIKQLNHKNFKELLKICNIGKRNIFVNSKKIF
jgi:DNA polymerase-3 subunit epsilon